MITSYKEKKTDNVFNIFHDILYITENFIKEK